MTDTRYPSVEALTAQPGNAACRGGSATGAPNVMVVIVNHGTPQLTIDCLRHLADQVRALPRAQVVVVDNTCDRTTAEQVITGVCRNGWFDWVTVMPLQSNNGFPHGNNAAIRPALHAQSPPDYFVLLNPDTVAHAGAISTLISFMESNAAVGIAGSRLVDADGVVQRSAHQDLSPLGELISSARLRVLSSLAPTRVVSPPPRDVAHRCDWVSGACMIVRRDVFETIGLIDEGFFLYFDDPDLCRRARQAGFEVWHVPQACVTHLEGQATDISNKRARRTAYWFESRRRFFVKAYGITGLIAADCLWALGRATLALRRLLRLGGGQCTEPKQFTRDLILGDLNALVGGRIGRKP